ASNLEAPQEADSVPIEAEPDREPGRQTQRATLCQDLERRVVDMSGALLESPGLSEPRVHALDATGAPSKERPLAPHQGGAPPHIDTLGDPSLRGIEHAAETIAEIPGSQQEDRRQEHETSEQN